MRDPRAAPPPRPRAARWPGATWPASTDRRGRRGFEALLAPSPGDRREPLAVDLELSILHFTDDDGRVHDGPGFGERPPDLRRDRERNPTCLRSTPSTSGSPSGHRDLPPSMW